MLFLVIIFFWKVFFKGLVPLPADFLVGTYYPWLDYKWGFPAGVPVKNPITTDVVSFSYPMRILAIDLMRNGLWPLWNRYILAGIPLLANFQSAPFTITNIFYVFTNNINGWSLQVISQHFFAMFFMYLLLRNWELSRPTSVAGGLIYAFSGFNLIWSQWNSHTLTAAFIPLLILWIDKYLDTCNLLFSFLFSITLSLQIFSGYPQAVLYTALIIGIYFVFRFKKNTAFYKKSAILALFGLAGIMISMPQILPAYELLKFSQRAVEPLEFDWAFLPWIKSITLLAPDFFGNHATKNYWGPGDYTMNTGYVGVIALILAFIALTRILKKDRRILFGALLMFLSLMLSFPTPASIYIWNKGLLGLQAASAHRAMLIFVFGTSILSAYGLEILFKKHKFNKIFALAPALLLLGVYTFSSTTAYLNSEHASFLIDYRDSTNVLVSLRNLVLPWFFLLAGTALMVIYNKLPKNVIFGIIFILMVGEIFRFGWKYTPFSPRNLVYPRTPIITYLQDQDQPFRVTGSDVIPINIRMQYRLESLEGYDAIYPVNIAKLIAVINSENIDASPQGRYGTVSNKYSSLLGLTNTKYILNLENEDNLKLPPAEGGYKEVFRDRSVVIYENQNSLPRSFWVGDWEFRNDDQNILENIVQGRLDTDKKILMSGEGPDSLHDGSDAKVEYLQYSDLESLISVKSDIEGYLFVSDAYYPGWKAYLNGEEVDIERADYAFRAVKVPAGHSVVRFIYRPRSFFYGLYLSLLSFTLTSAVLILVFVKHRSLSYTNHSPDE